MSSAEEQDDDQQEQQQQPVAVTSPIASAAAPSSALVPAGPASSATMDLQRHELLYLNYRNLMEIGCSRTAEVLREEIDEKGLMPDRIDWKGQRHKQTLADFERENCHIGPQHLPRLCAQLPELVARSSPPAVPGVVSLLGNGPQSLLRSHTPPVSSPPLCLVQRSLAVRGVSPQTVVTPNLTHFVMGREQSGRTAVSAMSPHLFKNQRMHRRYIGHLAPVFSVTFDRTGDHIITGADDSLVKIWSSSDGRLLATLRGHSKPITDFSINYENTLLATASADNQIRVWNLKTTAPVAILSGHTAQVTSVKFCPLLLKDGETRYLLSTSNDGTVCLWKWNVVTNVFDAKPIKFIERPKAGCHILASSFSTGGTFLAVGSTDKVIRVYHMDAPAGPTKHAELEVHHDQVDSLQFSNHSLRFVSGSRDGHAHIWYYEKQTWKNIPLRMTERLPNDPVIGNQDALKIKVNMVGWNSDDTYVLTSSSDYSLRVWDSKTGKLIHSLREHKDDAFMIEAHPFNPCLILTGGHDGYVMVWDIVRGVLVAKHHNAIEGQGVGSIFDCKWSPDGLSITTSDDHGHMAIIGFGDNVRHQQVPYHVFFHTDYRPLVRDNNGYVIDEQTQIPPHQMPPPFLVDMDGNPHPANFQRLVPGRENSRDDQLVPYISVNNERGVNEILQPVHQEPAVPAVQENPTIDDMIQLLNNQRLQQAGAQQQDNQIRQDHDYSANNGNNVINNNNNVAAPADADPVPEAADRRRNSNAENNASRARRQGEALQGVRQPGANWQSRDGTLATFWMHRTVVKPLPRPELNNVYRHLRDVAQLESEFFKSERRKRPPVTLQLVKEVNPKEKLTRRKRRLDQQRSGIPLDANYVARVRSLTNRRHTGITDYEVEDLQSDSSNEHRNSGAESWSESTSSSESESEESEEDGEARWNTSGRRGRRTGARKRAAESNDEDEDDDNYDEEDDDENEGEEAEEESESEDESSPKRPSRNSSVAKKKTIGKSKHEKLYSTIRELPDNFKFPEWLSDSTPKRNPYFPQIGDRVIYFKKGHQDYMKNVKLTNVYDMGTTAAAVLKKKFVKDEVDARVLDIKYEVKPPRLVTLKLGVIGPDGQLTKDSFSVRYHDMPNVIDFIVLKQFYDNGMQRKTYFKQGTRFKTVIDNEWFFGTIREWVEMDHSFQCVSIQYSTGENDFLSPWDIEPVTESDPASVGPDDHYTVSDEDRRMLAYEAVDEDQWPACGIDEECDRITRGLESIMELSMAEHFNTPVDLSQHPVYGMVIPYMIDLTTILNRLSNRFYRRKEALKFDISFIEKNALEFNESNSNICVSARMLTKVLLDFIDDITCEDPKPIWQRVLHNRHDYEIADEEDDEDEGASKKGKRSSSRKRTMGNEKSSSLKSSPKDCKKSWQQRCRELLDDLFKHPESAPFRAAVDPILYPDYNTVVDTPMDLNTVRESLMAGVYDNMREFRKDIDLIFQNSKTYNTDKRSHIYTMTLNMASYCKERLDEISRHHKRGAPAKGRSSKAVSRTKKPAKPPKKKRRSAAKKKAAGASCSDLSEPGPSGLCVRPSSEEAGPSSSGMSGKRRTASQRLTNGSAKQNNRDAEEDSDEDYAIVPKNLHHETDETEIEDNVNNSGNDTDATEIAENDTSLDSYGSRSSVEPPSSKRRRKGPAGGRNRAVKRLKKESHSDATEDDDDETVSYSTRTPSRSSNTTTTSASFSEGSYDTRRKKVPYVGKGKYPANKQLSRTRNGGVARVSYACPDEDVDSDGSDFDYNGAMPKNGLRMSSRGRVIRFKGQSRSAVF